MCPNLDISLVNMTIYAGYCTFACESWYQSFCFIPMGFVLNWGYILFFLHTITFCGIIISCTRQLALKIKIKIILASTKQSSYECTKMIHIELSYLASPFVWYRLKCCRNAAADSKSSCLHRLQCLASLCANFTWICFSHLVSNRSS